jgi:opacity protein-like surface antigen
MKKISSIFIILLLFCISIYGQSLKLGLSGGLTNISGPDLLTKDISENGFGYGAETHYGIKAKLGLPIIPLTFTGFVTNHALSSDEDGVEVSQNILSIGVGAEYALIPGPIAPYLALDVLSNSLGELEVNGNKQADGVSRVGISVGGGLDFKLLPKIDVDASVKYNIFNLIGKEGDEDNISSINLNVAILFSVI